MTRSRSGWWTRLAAALLLATGCAATATARAADRAETLLASIRPDYASYIAALRPLDAADRGRASRVYMVLVRPGATDPRDHRSAPFAGPGARNDILYDPTVFDGSRSTGWDLLLLDHEYFHARHLAGATSLPLPPRTGADIERHFFEMAAWGFTVSQARAGRYPGLREDEFREALDRYGEHYRALRALVETRSPASWPAIAAPLLRPLTLLTRR